MCLDQSFVLDIALYRGELVFDLDLALDSSHSHFREPGDGGPLWYRPGVLAFVGHEEVRWVEQSAVVYTDDSGRAVDRGTILSFRYGAGTYQLGGEWGVVRIRGGDCRLALARTPRGGP